jgi:hypothetical protein
MLRAVELLADEQWHDYDEVLGEVARLVPPGRALRANEAARRNAGNRSGKQAPAARVQQLPLARLVESGQRMVARSVLKHRGYFELDPAVLGNRNSAGVRIRMVAVPASVRQARELAAREEKTVLDHLRLARREGRLAEAVARLTREQVDAALIEVLRRQGYAHRAPPPRPRKAR